MNAPAIPRADRDRLNAAYRDLRKQTGLGGWLVKAYVLAAFWRTDAADAMARTHFGRPLAELGPGARIAAEQWLAKLDRAADAASKEKAP
jgi:hypothetical protein